MSPELDMDNFPEHVRLYTPDGDRIVGSMLIYPGDYVTRDGIFMNALFNILSRLPFIPIPNDFRHWVITDPNDGDGKPIKTVIGTLERAQQVAGHLLDRRFQVVENAQLGGDK